MFKATVRVSDETNVEAATAELSHRCERSSLTPQEKEDLAAKFSQVASSLVRRGQELRSSGAQIHVKREISGAHYLVSVIFQTGPKSTLRRALSFLHERG